MLIFSIILYFAVGALASLRFFRELTINKLAISFALVAILTNTLIVELLSVFHLVDRPILFLVVQFLFCGGMAVAVIDPKRKLFNESISRPKFQIKKLSAVDWLLTFLIVAVLAGYCYVGTLSPINNSDSLHTHLTRIYYWLQHGSLENWSAIIHSQVTYPTLIPIQGLWLFLLGGSEKLFFLVQWFSLLISVVVVFEIARTLGATPRQGLVAGLILLSYPAVLLQTFSFQGDLFVSSVLLLCVYMILRFEKTGSKRFLHLSILPLAAALGAKQTAFLVLPVYLVVIWLLLRKKEGAWNTGVRLLMVFLAAFTIIVSPKLIQNAVHKNEISGDMFSPTRYTIPFTRGTSFRGYATNTLRYVYQWISLDGLNGKTKLDAQDAKDAVFRFITQKVNLNLEARDYISLGDEEYFVYHAPQSLNEDVAWFGVFSWVLLPAALVVSLIRKEKNVRKYALASLILGVIYFFAVAILITGWGPTNGRYLIIPVIIMTPLTAFLIPHKKISGAIISAVIAVIAGCLAVSTMLINDSRPVVTKSTLYSVWAEKIETIKVTNIINSQFRAILNRTVKDLLLTAPDRVNIQQATYYEKLFFQNTADIQNIGLVNTSLAPDEPLYLRMNKSLVEYALFGINRTRDLYPVKQLSEVPSGSYVLVTNSLLDGEMANFRLITTNEEYSLFIRR